MFQQLLEELRKVREEMASKINGAKKLQEEVNRLTAENEALKEEIANHVCEKEIVEVPVPVECDHSALEQEIADLKQQIADHVCPTCNHEEELASLQAEIDELKKLLATN